MARRRWVITAVLAVAVTIETGFVRPELLEHLAGRPGLWILPLIIIAAFIGVFLALGRGREREGFVASSAVIAGLLVLTAGALYPLILPSSVDARYSLDITASNDDAALAIGLAWWIPAILLAIGYFVYLYRSFRGKATADYHVS
jgi:cytochrome d ubiquinol oxidase subunit II